MANTVVAQMLPSGVVKGGAAMQMRRGVHDARATTDLDTARPDVDADLWLDDLAVALQSGWQGFAGTVRRDNPATPAGVPVGYVMRPARIALSYRGGQWTHVRLELSADEVGSADEADTRLDHSITQLFVDLGLPTPRPVPLMLAEHQIAQRLHACTHPPADGHTNDRAHDLVDVLLLLRDQEVDHDLLARTCRRLFASRATHEWPALVAAHPGWTGLYAGAADRLPVPTDVDVAVDLVNRLLEDLADL